MKDEKVWNQDLWKPLGIKEVDAKDYPCRNNGKLNSFLDYQAPNDRYEVRGLMPKAPQQQEYKQLLKKL